MTIEEIIRGESKKAEFKEMPSKNTEKYTKTVVAYANTQGGKLVFGVVDETREVVGIDESILFQTMDSITNAISDSCEPQIVPEIQPYTVERKTVIVVTVAPEPWRPYYVNLYRNPLPMQGVGQTSVEHRQNIGDESVERRSNDGVELNATQRKIVEMLSANSGMTGAALAEQIGISKRNIETNIKKLKELGILIRHGSSKGGYWEVLK